MADMLDTELRTVANTVGAVGYRVFEILQAMLKLLENADERNKLEQLLVLEIKKTGSVSILKITGVPKEELEEFFQSEGIAGFDMRNIDEKSHIIACSADKIDELSDFLDEYNYKQSLITEEQTMDNDSEELNSHAYEDPSDNNNVCTVCGNDPCTCPSENEKSEEEKCLVCGNGPCTCPNLSEEDESDKNKKIKRKNKKPNTPYINPDSGYKAPDNGSSAGYISTNKDYQSTDPNSGYVSPNNTCQSTSPDSGYKQSKEYKQSDKYKITQPMNGQSSNDEHSTSFSGGSDTNIYQENNKYAREEKQYNDNIENKKKEQSNVQKEQKKDTFDFNAANYNERYNKSTQVTDKYDLQQHAYDKKQELFKQRNTEHAKCIGSASSMGKGGPGIPNTNNSLVHSLNTNVRDTGNTKAEMKVLTLHHGQEINFSDNLKTQMFNFATMNAQQARNTETYQGYKEFKTHSSFLTSGLLATSAKCALADNVYKMNKLSQNGDLKYLNKLLRESGQLAKSESLNFASKKTANMSNEAIEKLCASKGLIKKNNRGEIDTKKLMKISTNDFANMFGLKDKTLARNLEEQIKGSMKNQALALNMKKNKFKKVKNSVCSIIRKANRNDVTMNGFLEVKATVRTMKQAFVAGKQFGKLSIKATKMILKHNPATFVVKKTVGKAIVKTDTYKKAQEIRFNRISAKKTNVETKIKKKIQKKRINSKLKDRRVNKFKRTLSNKLGVTRAKAGVNRAKAAIVKRINPKVLTSAKKVTGAVSKAFGAAKNFSNKTFGKLANFFNVIDKAKKWLVIIGGAIILGMIAIMGTVMIAGLLLTTIVGFLDNNDNVYESTVGKAYTDLLAQERDWVKNLGSLGKDLTQNIDALNYTTAYLSISEYATQLGLIYVDDGTNKGVTGLEPFIGAPTAAYKFIDVIDGGSEMSYKDSNGITGKTSNIKEILAMAAVYYQQESDNLADTYGETANEDANFWNQSWNFLKKAVVFVGKYTNPLIYVYDKSKNEDVIRNYAKVLFEVSHQEGYELEPFILPTKYTTAKSTEEDSISDIDADANGEIGEGTTLSPSVTMCPSEDYGGDGCLEYNGFYYIDGIDNLYAKFDAGVYTDVSKSVAPVKYDFCTAPQIGMFIPSYNRFPKCWEVNESVDEVTISKSRKHKSSSSSSYRDNEGTPEEADPMNDYTYDLNDPKISNLTMNGAFMSELRQACSKSGKSMKLETAVLSSLGKVMHNGVTSNVYSVRVDVGDAYSDSDEHYHITKQTRVTVTFTHFCQGCHTGHYCGGHFKAHANGYVYGLTQDEIDGKNIVGKYEIGEYKKKRLAENSYNTSSINDDKLKTAIDIFDIDTSIYRKTDDKDWESWTDDNMQWAITMATQNWENLYGIKLSSVLGGTPLTETEIKEIMAALKSNYPDLSDERRKKILLALSYVGNIGYDQGHHAHPLDGPCPALGTGEPCYLSDCSGFVSNIWMDHVGQYYTTGSFWTSFKCNSFSDGGCKPGDILLHYEGNIGDCSGDHALMYIGNINGEDLSIDCTTVNGIGQVRYTHRNYYKSCYYISMGD